MEWILILGKLFLLTILSFYSIQITDWKSEEILGYRNTSSAPILDIVFNTYNKYEFATCGHYNIAIWDFKGKTVNRKEWMQIKEGDNFQLPFFTAVSYINYHVIYLKDISN